MFLQPCSLELLKFNFFTANYNQTTLNLNFFTLPIKHDLIAKLSSSLVPVKSNLNWDLHYNHSETTHPGKYNSATYRLPRKVKVGVEALYYQTKSTS